MAKVVFLLYLVVAIIALLTVMVDPVWSGRGRGGEIHGLLGFMALFAAALPWSLVFFFIKVRSSPETTDLIVSGVNFGFIVLNLSILGWLAFRRARTSRLNARTEADGSSNDK
jgi:hypothetical protein